MYMKSSAITKSHLLERDPQMGSSILPLEADRFSVAVSFMIEADQMTITDGTISPQVVVQIQELGHLRINDWGLS